MATARSEMVALGLVVGSPLVAARLGTPPYGPMHLARMTCEVSQQGAGKATHFWADVRPWTSFWILVAIGGLGVAIGNSSGTLPFAPSFLRWRLRDLRFILSLRFMGCPLTISLGWGSPLAGRCRGRILHGAGLISSLIREAIIEKRELLLEGGTLLDAHQFIVRSRTHFIRMRRGRGGRISEQAGQGIGRTNISGGRKLDTGWEGVDFASTSTISAQRIIIPNTCQSFCF